MMNQYVHARRWAVTLLMGLVCLFAFAQGQNVTGTVTDPGYERQGETRRVKRRVSPVILGGTGWNDLILRHSPPLVIRTVPLLDMSRIY